MLEKWKEIQNRRYIFISASILKRWRSHKSNSISSSIVQAVEFLCRGTNSKKKYVNLRKMHENAPETDDIVVENCSHVRFPTKFVCLGTTIDFLMGDSEDINNSINKASKSMDTLKFILNGCNAPIETNIKLFSVIPLNCLL